MGSAGGPVSPEGGKTIGAMIEQLVQRFEGGQLSRRELVASLSALFLTKARPSVSARQASAQIFVRTLNHVTLTVADVQRSVEF